MLYNNIVVLNDHTVCYDGVVLHTAYDHPLAIRLREF